MKRRGDGNFTFKKLKSRPPRSHCTHVIISAFVTIGTHMIAILASRDCGRRWLLASANAAPLREAATTK